MSEGSFLLRWVDGFPNVKKKMFIWIEEQIFSESERQMGRDRQTFYTGLNNLRWKWFLFEKFRDFEAEVAGVEGKVWDRGEKEDRRACKFWDLDELSALHLVGPGHDQFVWFVKRQPIHTNVPSINQWFERVFVIAMDDLNTNTPMSVIAIILRHYFALFRVDPSHEGVLEMTPAATYSEY